MKKITRGIKLYICEETEKIYLEFKDYFEIKHPKNMLAYYLLIREPTDALEKLIRDYYENCENEYEKERERKKQFVQKTAQKLYAELSPERRAKLYMNANPAEEHFGLGLYIRNKYIFTDEDGIDLPACSPDLLSSEILSCLVSILVGYDYNDPFYRGVYEDWNFPWFRKLYFTLFGKFPDELLEKYARRKRIQMAVKSAIAEVHDAVINKERFDVQAKKYGLSAAKIRDVQNFFESGRERCFEIPYDLFFLGCDSPKQERKKQLQILKLILEKDSDLMWELPCWLFTKQDAVLVAVSVKGVFLKRFRRFNADDIVIQAALQNCGNAIQYVNPAVRNRDDYIRLALTDPYGSALHMPCMKKYRDCDEWVRLAVTINGRNIQFASRRLRDDFDMACVAVTHQQDFYPEDTIKHLSKRLRDSKEIALLDMEKGHGCFDDYSKRLRNDLELAILNAEKGRGSIEDYSRKLRDSDEVAQALIKGGRTYYLYDMSDRIKSLYMRDEND